MKIVHRADASRSTGTGHVMRTLTLAAAAVDRGHDVELHARALPPLLVERADRLGVRVVEVTAQGWSEEATAVLGVDADAICLDGYGFAPEFVESVRATRGVLIAIDDNREMPLSNVDMILNQNPHATPELYRDLHPRRLLLGPRFALVRDEVTRLARRDVTSNAERVVVSMGGTDTAGLTLPSLQMLIDATDLGIDVTFGIDSAGAEACRAFVAEHADRIREIDPHDLPTALARGDLAVLAAGSTLWEAAALGVPTVALAVADNQIAPGSAAADAGALILHDARNGFDRAAVAHAVTMLASDQNRRRQMAGAGRAMVDGKGRTRVVRAIEALTGSVKHEENGPRPDESALITLRPLVSADSARLLRWRNQPEVAAQMFTDHAIGPAEHERWFARAMHESPHAVYRIVEAGAVPIGLVSLTDIDQGTCTWGGYIGELDWHGRGAGTGAIWLSLELAFTELQRDQVLVEVFATNRRAADLYARFGFTERADLRRVVMKSGGYSDVSALVLSREGWTVTRPLLHHVLKQRGLIP